MRELISALIKNASFMFVGSVLAATNLVQNPGFEEGVYNWITYGVSVEQTSIEKNSGDYSLKTTTNSLASGPKYVYQVVGITGGNYYQAKVFAKKTGEVESKVYLRLAFYESSDGSGSQISTATSNEITSNLDSFTQLSIDSVQAPSNAKSAKVRLTIEMPSNAQTNGISYFDDVEVSLTEGSSPSSSPTQTPVQTQDGILKINDVKGVDGNILSSVKVYIDGVYLHHYAPEDIKFCDGCSCDSLVSCGFGSHELKLEKSGYQDFTNSYTINSGDTIAVDASMSQIPDEEDAQTSSPPTPTLSELSIKSQTQSTTNRKTSESEEYEQDEQDEVVLGLRNEGDEITEHEEAEVLGAQETKKFPVLALLLVLAGVGTLGVGAFPFLKTKFKGYTLISGKNQNNPED